MKKIAILTCLKATGVCSGAACFRALNQREKAFAAYADGGVELRAFFHCNGCDCDHTGDKEFREKIERVMSLGLDAVHMGVCTRQRGVNCAVISSIAATLEERGIPVIWGTH